MHGEILASVFFVYHNMPNLGFLLIILAIIAHPAASLRHILDDSQKTMSVMNEFFETLEKLNGCIATLQAGCTLSSDEGLYADSIYYRCKQYIEAYQNAMYSIRDI